MKGVLQYFREEGLQVVSVLAKERLNLPSLNETYLKNNKEFVWNAVHGAQFGMNGADREKDVAALMCEE